MSVSAPETMRAEVAGVSVERSERGKGRPLLFLHPGHPSGRVDPAAPVLELLAENRRVIAPTHPGFGMDAAPPKLTTIDDLAYLYLDLMEALDLRGCVLVGVGLGGWIAAEMAVKNCERLSHLVLANAVGIKVGNRETRDIADIYAVTDKQLAELVYADPARMVRDSKTLPQNDLVMMARSREATGRYGWTPYLHNPKLKGRLHRVHIPTLVLWGEADRVVTPDYGRAYADAIPGARFATIGGAGHFPHLEQPETFASRVLEFVEETHR
ncbi:MAG TPA: alpha/beta hydrolase [Micropepsaceae bacterium]|nr:alpha/beta hydrolase [Micropepsaceae bacterium]